MKKSALSSQKGIVSPLIIVGVVVGAIILIGVLSGSMKFSGSIKYDKDSAPEYPTPASTQDSVSQPTPEPSEPAAAAITSSVLNDEPYSSSSMKFSIKYPKGWEVKLQSTSVNIFLQSKTKGAGQADALMTLSSTPGAEYKDTKLSTLADLQKVNINKTFSDVKFTGEMDTKVGGLPAYEIEFTGSLNGEAIHAKYYIVTSGGMLYSLITLTTEDVWSENQSNFMASLDTFKSQ